MPQPIGDPNYWKKRLQDAKELHHAIFKCPLDRWLRIEAKHKAILAKTIEPSTSVLDAGCGYGRLLKLMPSHWYGDYIGIDISPDFLDLASREYPMRAFVTASLADLAFLQALPVFDLAIMVSVRPMVIREMGVRSWMKMEEEIRRRARKLLFLEYDEDSNGSLE